VCGRHEPSEERTIISTNRNATVAFSSVSTKNPTRTEPEPNQPTHRTGTSHFIIIYHYFFTFSFHISPLRHATHIAGGGGGAGGGGSAVQQVVAVAVGRCSR
jgi:hypothetical protein